MSKKNPAQIYLRFIHSSKLDVFIKSDLFINPKHWDKKKQRVKNMAEATQKDLVNATLEKLSIYLIEQMNKDHISGHIIDKSWARNKVADFFGGVYEKDKAIALTEWIEEYREKAPTLIKKNKDKPLSQNTLSSYKTTLSKIKDFQEYKNIQLKFTDIHLAFHKELINYLNKVEQLGSGSTWAMIKNLKVLSRVAKLEGLRVHKEIEHPEFFVPRASSSKTESVYLSDQEINKIYDLDLSANATLDNVRHCNQSPMKDLFEKGLDLVTKTPKNVKNKLMNAKHKLLLGRRGMMESIIAILKSVCDIEHSRHRNPLNAFLNIFARLAAYSFLDRLPSGSF